MLQVTTSVTKKWQVTIPASVRQALGLKKPGKVQLEVNTKKKTIRIKPKVSFLKLAGILPPINPDGEKLKPEKIREQLEKLFLLE